MPQRSFAYAPFLLVTDQKPIALAHRTLGDPSALAQMLRNQTWLPDDMPGATAPLTNLIRPVASVGDFCGGLLRVFPL